jgi:mono/diheme cytochrome c family protein
MTKARSIPISLAAAAAVVLIGASGLSGAASAASTSAPGEGGAVSRGKYLVTIGGCNDCHTPWKVGPTGPQPDMSRMLSGHPEGLAMPPAPKLGEGAWVTAVAGSMTAWSGPWGVSFTANLTPDAETGIGKWTEKDFMDTIRTGRHLGRGRQILPPMPWFNYAEMSDDDLRAVFAYLKSIPPVRNRVPAPLPPAAASR